ncbi:MAG TPA: hypothetical protein VN615_16965 [Gaiellales bacterium]|nr:hypothetical protein [Gaiellales bacterium]
MSVTGWVLVLTIVDERRRRQRCRDSRTPADDRGAVRAPGPPVIRTGVPVESAVPLERTIL